MLLGATKVMKFDNIILRYHKEKTAGGWAKKQYPEQLPQQKGKDKEKFAPEVI